MTEFSRNPTLEITVDFAAIVKGGNPMHVIQETKTNLFLQLRPWSSWCFGATFALAGLAMTVLGSQLYTFRCDRTESTMPVCQLSSDGLLGTTEQIVPLDTIQGTRIDTLIDVESTTYQLYLITDDGEIAVIPMRTSNYGNLQQLASQIDEFLNDPQATTLLIQEDYRGMGIVFGGLFVVAGLAVVVLFGSVITCSIDKSLGTLVLESNRLGHRSRNEYALRDLYGVAVEFHRANRGGRTYRVALVMQSGDRVPLTAYYSSGLNKKQQTADRICAFLNLKPIQDDDRDSTYQDILSTVQRLADLAFRGKEYRETMMAELQQSVLQNPDDAEANYQLGLALYFLKQHNEAKPLLERAKRRFSLEGQGQKVHHIDTLLRGMAR